MRYPRPMSFFGRIQGVSSGGIKVLKCIWFRIT